MTYKRGFKGKRRKNDPTYKEYDPEYHCKNLIELMAKGLLDCEIESIWHCSHTRFYTWRKKYPELQEAYDIGFSKRMAYKVETYIRPMMEGKIEGKHAFNATKYLMDAEFNYTKPIAGTTAQNNISIGSITVNNSSPQQLIEKLQENLSFLERKNVLNVEYKVIENDSEPNKQDSSRAD